MAQNGRDLPENDPLMKERGLYITLKFPEGGEMLSNVDSFRLSVTPGSPRWHAPLLGKHSDYVYRDVLGMSEEEFGQ